MEESKFETVPAREAKILLQSGGPAKSKLHIWTEGQRFAVRTRVQRVTESGDHLYVGAVKDPATTEFENQVRAAGIEAVMSTLYLPTDILFFRAELKKGDFASVQLRVAPPVYKLQRRRSLRVPFSGDDAPIATIKIGPSDFPIVARVLNAAEGGIAITLQDEEEYKRLQLGQKVMEIQVRIADVDVKCKGDVRHASEIPSSPRLKKHYKIGLRFDGIPEASMERIARFVWETSAKFMGRI